MGEVWLLLRFTQNETFNKSISVAGVYADYACCPYNDYGVVDGSCPYSERTAWGDADQQVGLTKNECKAWEANVDATKDGSNSPAAYNWGGCGFQRLFDWEGKANGVANAAISAVNGYDSIELDDGGSTISVAMADPFGKVALNGLCALFIPVAHADIQYVSVAGVHVKGNGFAVTSGCAGGNGLGCSVFSSNLMSGAVARSRTTFPFAVSNDHEGLTNNNNNILNANVAGGVGTDTALSYTQFEWDGDAAAGQITNNRKWGDSLTWPGYPAAGGAATTELNSDHVGANFDVVVHLKSTWCQTHWTRIDMQDAHTVGGESYTESGHGTVDYTVFASNANDWPGSNGAFTHAHKDAMDKRFSADICGYSSGAANNIFGAPTTNSCAAGTWIGNSLASGASTKWPNAGAWAGAFSHVYCTGNAVSSSHLIYKQNWGAGEAASQQTPVLSNFNNDWRRIDGAGTADINIRGNIRQVGTAIDYCSPGYLPAAGGVDCTWNWNFQNAHLDGSAFDGPTFDNSNPRALTWAGVSALPRAFEVCLAHGNAQQAGVAAAVSYPLPVSTAGTPTCDGTQCTATAGSGNNCATFTVTCDNAGAATVAGKDDFPACFQGDEIHFNFKYSGSDSATNYEHITYVSAWYSTVDDA